MDPDAFAIAFLSTLSRISLVDPDAARRRWKNGGLGGSFHWASRCIEAGQVFFASLSPGRVEEIANGIRSPTARAALYVSILEEKKGPRVDDQAFAAIGEIGQEDDRQLWLMRFLNASSRVDRNLRLHLLRTSIQYAVGNNYHIGKERLRLFFDLIARFFPKHLRDLMDGAVWASAADEEALLHLSEHGGEPLLIHLFHAADLHAIIAAGSEAEGLALRRRLLTTLGARLCLLQGNSNWIEEAEKALTPDERDELRIEAALVLDAEGKTKLSHKALQRIRSRRSRLLTALMMKAPPESLQTGLDLSHLYEFLSDSDFIRNELRRLRVLNETPNAPERLNEEHLSRIEDPVDFTTALVDLSMHAVAFQQRRFPAHRRDLARAFHSLRQAAAMWISDERLLSLTLEILELSTQKEAMAFCEFEEAIREIIALETVDWPIRFAMLHQVLARVEPLLLSDNAGTRNWRARCKKTADLFRRLVKGEDAVEERRNGPLREKWHILLPVFMARAEILPGTARRYFHHPLRARFRFNRLGVAWQFTGWEAMRDALRNVANKWIPGWSANRCEAGRPRSKTHWAWLDTRRQAILEPCFARDDNRFKAASKLLSEAGPELSERLGLVFLLAALQPSAIPEHLDTMAAGDVRDQLCLNLIQGRWLPLEIAEDVISFIHAPGIRLRAELTLMLWPENAAPREASVNQMIDWLAAERVSSHDPLLKTLLRTLWSREPSSHRDEMNYAIIRALAEQGADGGRTALKTWLNIHLAPRPGEKNPDHERKTTPIIDGVREARFLPGAAPFVDGAPSDRDAGKNDEKEDAKKRKRLTDLFKKWEAHLSMNELFERLFLSGPAKSLDKTALLAALLFVPALILLDYSFWEWLLVGPNGFNIEPGAPNWILPSIYVIWHVLNAWTFNGILSVRTKGGTRYRLSFRLARFLSVGFPIFGLFMLSI